LVGLLPGFKSNFLFTVIEVKAIASTVWCALSHWPCVRSCARLVVDDDEENENVVEHWKIHRTKKKIGREGEKSVLVCEILVEQE